jgi:lysine N6-hydroxylase
LKSKDQNNLHEDNLVYDFIAIGVGPFNLGLAALTSTLDEVNSLFLDQRSEFDWHPGLMIEGVHLQTPFLSDLVTLADPTHPLSFLSYMKKQGRIYSFYIRENFFLLREEYNLYCQWATRQMSHIRWCQRVESVLYNDELSCYELSVVDTETFSVQRFYTNKLVLGTGPQPNWPKFHDQLIVDNQHVFHSGDYLSRKKEFQQQKNITVLGSGQSAAEIFHDLLQDIDSFDYTLNWCTSSPRIYPLEYTKLTLEMTSPEYVDYFHALPSDYRSKLVGEQKNLYKGVNSSLINQIYDLLYTKRLKMEGRKKHLNVNIFSNSFLRDAVQEQDSILLDFHHAEQNKSFQIRTQGVALCTGYQYREPEFLGPIQSRILYNKDNKFYVHRNYSIDISGKEIFVQNAELHSHGFVTPDLGMACYRNSKIIKEITGIEYYPVEERIAFQDFGVPECAELTVPDKKVRRELDCEKA